MALARSDRMPEEQAEVAGSEAEGVSLQNTHRAEKKQSFPWVSPGELTENPLTLEASNAQMS